MECSSGNAVKSLNSLTNLRPNAHTVPNQPTDFAQEFLQQNPSQIEEPLQLNHPHRQIAPWKNEFLSGAMNSLSISEIQAFESVFQKANLGDSWKSEFHRNDADWDAKFESVLNSLNESNKSSTWEEEFNNLTNNETVDWNEKFKDILAGNHSNSDWKSDFVENSRIIDPDPVTAPSNNYIFEVDNAFMLVSDPYAEGLKLLNEEGQLSQAALAFEAAVQKDPSNSNAWYYLGTTQAENEKEGPALLALERSVKEDPLNAPAFMSLAVSYTNEGMDLQAFMSLKRWINIKYPSITAKHNPDILAEVTSLFLDAARNPSLHVSGLAQSLDPDVQSGLGVLFYNAGDFDKAIDCFNSALSVRPQDYNLWSRLGATLANSGNTEEAIDAYYKALKIRPTFVRGRYNLGVGCINIGCYKQAAEHFLGALSLHRQDEKANISQNLWDTLRRTFILMERHDLCDLTQKRDLNLFRNEFDFLI